MTARAVPPASTRERILDAAERLFLEKGFRGTSLRELSAAAAVNLAGVGYHFGGKHELLRAVLERRIEPVNRERLARLDAVEAGWRQGRPRRLEPVLAALLEPAFASVHTASASRDIATLLYSEPHGEMAELIEGLFGECSQRFQAAVARVLGRGDARAAALRFQIVIGAMIHFLAGRHRLAPGAASREPSGRELVDALVGFLAAGLRAAAPARAHRTRSRRTARAREISP
jgi:AcrR family transcriptional regulator